MTMMKVTNPGRKDITVILSDGTDKVIPARGSAMIDAVEIEKDTHGSFRTLHGRLVVSVPVAVVETKALPAPKAAAKQNNVKEGPSNG